MQSDVEHSPNLPYSKRVGSRVAALLIQWTSQSGRSLQRGKLELQIVSSHFTHDCTLVLYKQLIQTGSVMGFSYFPLCWAFLSTRTQPMGEPPHTSSIALLQVFGLVPMPPVNNSQTLQNHFGQESFGIKCNFFFGTSPLILHPTSPTNYIILCINFEPILLRLQFNSLPLFL